MEIKHALVDDSELEIDGRIEDYASDDIVVIDNLNDARGSPSPQDVSVFDRSKLLSALVRSDV